MSENIAFIELHGIGRADLLERATAFGSADYTPDRATILGAHIHDFIQENLTDEIKGVAVVRNVERHQELANVRVDHRALVETIRNARDEARIEEEHAEHPFTEGEEHGRCIAYNNVLEWLEAGDE